MARPKKCRKVCCMPCSREFVPSDIGSSAIITMTVDEYETIRLIDLENFSQEDCGKYMQIARTTVQTIYNSAREKLAEALVSGAVLRIEGGDYILCDGLEKECACGGCKKHRRDCEKEK